MTSGLAPRKRGARGFSALASIVFAVLTMVATVPTPIAAQTPPKTKFTIGGMVLAADGKPAAGIEVKLIKPMPDSKGKPTPRPPGKGPTGDDLTKLQSGEPPRVGRGETVLKTITTDAAGKFAFADLDPAKYGVLAGKDKQAARADVLINNADPAPLTLKLAK